MASTNGIEMTLAIGANSSSVYGALGASRGAVVSAPVPQKHSV